MPTDWDPSPSPDDDDGDGVNPTTIEFGSHVQLRIGSLAADLAG